VETLFGFRLFSNQRQADLETVRYDSQEPFPNLLVVKALKGCRPHRVMNCPGTKKNAGVLGEFRYQDSIA
jgi:hypothetical protein